MKKLLATLLSLVMVLAMATTPLAMFAETEPTPVPTSGSITINNAVADVTYSIYRVFDVITSGSNLTTVYYYKLSDKWNELSTYEYIDTSVDPAVTYKASDYFTVDSQDSHIIWKSSISTTPEKISEFYRLLKQYQQDKRVENDGEELASSATASFTNLSFGYYFIDSTQSNYENTLCVLNAANAEVEIPVVAVAPSITINNAVAGQTYKIYRVFDLEVDNETRPTAYFYTLNEKWNGLRDYTPAREYFDVDPTDGHIVWSQDDNGNYTIEAAGFAELLDAFLATEAGSSITPDRWQTAALGPVVFSNLPLGYYFVQSTLGAVCSLDTTNPRAEIQEKNGEPTVDKQVWDNGWGDTNDVNIGDVISFMTTITAQAGAENYVLHDVMEHMTFKAVEYWIYDSTSYSWSINDTDGLHVELVRNGEEPEPVYPTIRVGENTIINYEVVTTGLTDSCSFEVSFKEAFCNSLNAGDQIIVYYSATLNEDAVIGGNGNRNDTSLSYGDGNTTEHDITRTYTWEIPIYKYTGTLPGTPLADAKFVLYKIENGVKYYAEFNDRGRLTKFVEAITVEPPETPAPPYRDAAILVTGEDGKVTAIGLDEGTYYLEEIEAPAGYNLPGTDDNPITVIITSEPGNTTDPTLTPAIYQNQNPDDEGAEPVPEISVLNQTGSVLPSTGGIGTTIFYIVGGALVIGAAVFLIVRRRMSAGNPNAE